MKIMIFEKEIMYQAEKFVALLIILTKIPCFRM